MVTLRLVPADDAPTDEPLRFPTEAARSMNSARAASSNSAKPEREPLPRLGTPDDVLTSLANVTRCANNITRDLDVLGHLSAEGNGDDDRPRAA